MSERVFQQAMCKLLSMRTPMSEDFKFFGTVSEGTLRSQDLAPKFLSVLEELMPEAYQQMQMPGAGFQTFPEYALEDSDSEWWDSEECQWAMDALFDALNACAPEGYYFGSHEGDGADFGFWESE
jgi:hypothetical protein